MICQFFHLNPQALSHLSFINCSWSFWLKHRRVMSVKHLLDSSIKVCSDPDLLLLLPMHPASIFDEWRDDPAPASNWMGIIIPTILLYHPDLRVNYILSTSYQHILYHQPSVLASQTKFMKIRLWKTCPSYIWWWWYFFPLSWINLPLVTFLDWVRSWKLWHLLSHLQIKQN